MSKERNVTGFRSGRLLVLSRNGLRLSCICDCGTKVDTDYSSVMYGRSKSCGCWAKEVQRARLTTHGKSFSKTYNSWAAMIQRCTNPKNADYHSYGERGITVCERWMKFENFLEDMGERPQGKTVDRKDTNGNYEPNNCCWSTAKEQADNRRVVELTFEGTTQSVEAWSVELDIPKVTIYDRIRRYGLERTDNILKVGRCKRIKL